MTTAWAGSGVSEGMVASIEIRIVWPGESRDHTESDMKCETGVKQGKEEPVLAKQVTVTSQFRFRVTFEQA